MAAHTIYVQTPQRRPEACTRCRERKRTLETPDRLCLACIEYLATEGGRWSAGDDSYMQAIREWLGEQLSSDLLDSRIEMDYPQLFKVVLEVRRCLLSD